MKTLAMSFLLVVSLPLVADEIRMEYNFLDGVVARRMILGLPEYDRTEFLGTGSVYVNGVSSGLIGQYDLSLATEDAAVLKRFKECVSIAKQALVADKALVVTGVATQPIGGGYKNLIMLSDIKGCAVR